MWGAPRPTSVRPYLSCSCVVPVGCEDSHRRDSIEHRKTTTCSAAAPGNPALLDCLDLLEQRPPGKDAAALSVPTLSGHVAGRK